MQKQNIGNAGEYYIASRLSAEDFIATITLGRAEKYDILAVSPSNRIIKLSIKIAFKNAKYVKDFPLSEKDEKGGADDFFYVFVRLNEYKSEPDFWVIPSKTVNKVIKEADEKYLSAPGKKGQIRNPSALRILPVVVRDSQKDLYPKDWELEIEKYYKNIGLLK